MKYSVTQQSKLSWIPTQWFNVKTEQNNNNNKKPTFNRIQQNSECSQDFTLMKRPRTPVAWRTPEDAPFQWVARCLRNSITYEQGPWTSWREGPVLLPSLKQLTLGQLVMLSEPRFSLLSSWKENYLIKDTLIQFWKHILSVNMY